MQNQTVIGKTLIYLPPMATVVEQITTSSSPTTDVVGTVNIEQSPLNVVVPASPAVNTPVVQAEEEVLGRGQRPRVPSVKLKDYVMYNAIHLENPSLTPAVLHHILMRQSKVTHYIL